MRRSVFENNCCLSLCTVICVTADRDSNNIINYAPKLIKGFNKGLPVIDCCFDIDCRLLLMFRHTVKEGSSERNIPVSRIGRDFSPPATVAAMLEDQESYVVVVSLYEAAP